LLAGKKRGGQQGALGSAGRPNLQGHSVQVQLALHIAVIKTDSNQYQKGMAFRIQEMSVG
jgi:hypothetical protein